MNLLLKTLKTEFAYCLMFFYSPTPLVPLFTPKPKPEHPTSSKVNAKPRTMNLKPAESYTVNNLRVLN